MIISQTDNRICVKLTSMDMLELDITYEELDYSNIETRRVLWTLLDEARHKLGHNIHLSERMIVEAVPDVDGGCSIYFTVNSTKNDGCENVRHMRFRDSRIVCCSDNIDNIAELAKALTDKSKILQSELFTDGKNYRMILKPDMIADNNVSHIISEFCDICDDDVIPATYEYWKMLASPDAIGLLWALSD